MTAKLFSPPIDREASYKEQIKSLTTKLKQADSRAEFAEKSVQKLQKEVRAGHLGFAVLQLSAKSCFQTNLTILISNFWVTRIKKNATTSQIQLIEMQKVAFFLV